MLHMVPSDLKAVLVQGLRQGRQAFPTDASCVVEFVPMPSKRGPGLGSFSRADRGIGGIRPVAPPTWLVSNLLVRPASS